MTDFDRSRRQDRFDPTPGALRRWSYRHPVRYWALIIGLGAISGCSFLFNAVLIREISPLWVSAGRVTIGALVADDETSPPQRPVDIRGRARR